MVWCGVVCVCVSVSVLTAVAVAVATATATTTALGATRILLGVSSSSSPPSFSCDWRCGPYGHSLQVGPGQQLFQRRGGCVSATGRQREGRRGGGAELAMTSQPSSSTRPVQSIQFDCRARLCFRLAGSRYHHHQHQHLSCSSLTSSTLSLFFTVFWRLFHRLPWPPRGALWPRCGT